MKTTYSYNREMPVSAKFYSRLCIRVSSILAALGHNTDSGEMEEVMLLVNLHLGALSANQRENNVSFVSRVIFQTLRAEIDAAVERSRRCREAAARRRTARTVAEIPTFTVTESESLPQVRVESEPEPDNITAQARAEISSSATQLPKSSFKKLKFKPVVKAAKRTRAKFRKR